MNWMQLLRCFRKTFEMPKKKKKLRAVVPWFWDM